MKPGMFIRTLAAILLLVGLAGGCAQSSGTATTTTTSTTSGGGTTTTTTTPITVTTNPSGKHGLTNIFFLHHSIGGDLVERGGVRAAMSAYASGFTFWDQGYRLGGGQEPSGLRNASGTLQGTDYYAGVVADGTDPVDLASLFTTDNVVRSRILANHQVIAFKSCYTAVENLNNDAVLTEYKNYYLSMRSYFDSRQDKLFVVLTDPPTVSGANGTRGRTFANWLQSTAAGGFLEGSHPNIVVFDLFNYLADGTTNLLRSDYVQDAGDSHPNEVADLYIGPIFARFLVDSARNY
jgi:hypothetical protein